MAGVSRRRGPWSEAHVERLFWRAGFGARPAEVAHWAKAGRRRTIDYLLDTSRPEKLLGPGPAKPLDPFNEWGHATIWWLDRMARTNQPLREKMALFWHDHFATRDQDTPLMLKQNALFRRRALGRFDVLLREVLVDPAMAQFLSVVWSHKDHPNENFARELMELFTMGTGYTERDIREASRGLTGFVPGVKAGGVLQSVRFKADNHDDRRLNVLGRRGPYLPDDVLDVCLDHARHPGFLVSKLWAFFITEPLDPATRKRLERLYVTNRRSVRPVVEAILDHPALYHRLDAPEMVKAPAVYIAGLLRATWTPITESWGWRGDQMGQRLFSPPDVGGWQWGSAWMSSGAMRARFDAVNELLGKDKPAGVPDGSTPFLLTPAQHVERAHRAVGRPWTSAKTRRRLEALAAEYQAKPARRPADVQRNADMTQRTLRHLLLSGPDNQLH